MTDMLILLIWFTLMATGSTVLKYLRRIEMKINDISRHMNMNAQLKSDPDDSN
jgi:hypothetical protein